MSSRTRIAILLVAAVAGTIALIHAPVATPRRQVSAGVHLTFQGMTNLVGSRASRPSGRFAAFQLHNESGIRLMYVPESVEVQTESGWLTNRLSGKPPVNWWHLGCVLSDREKHVFLVPLPSTNQSWLIRLTCYERAGGVRGLMDSIHGSTGNRDGNEPKYETFGPNRFQVVSSVVSP
jgi:hypothetical protein